MSALRIGSLFSGIGGLDLAVEAVTGGDVAWFCEADPYARRVLARHWPGVPIFEDVRELSQPPAVDVLCGGFPCQDISNAGKREGIDGAKSGLWREFARLIRDVGPRWVFLENVAALTIRGIGRVLADLAACGFDAEWGCLRASDVGAPHIRNRWFCFGWMADADAPGLLSQRQAGALGCDSHTGSPHVGDASGDGFKAARRGPQFNAAGEGPLCAVSDAKRDALRQLWQWQREQYGEQGPAVLVDASEAAGRAGDPFRWDHLPSPGVCRGADGSAHVVDRLRCLGNAVVPQQAAWAFEQLIRRAGQ